MSDPDVITITVAEFERLLRDSKILSALEVHGVDNWEGFSEAMGDLEDEDDE